MAKRIHLTDPKDALTDDLIMQNIERGSRVLDMGCGDGRLLERLHAEHGCDVLGVEIDFDRFVAAIERGVPVVQANLDRGLQHIPDRSFDVAVLSRTLQEVHRPLKVLDEIFRIAHRALVVLPNFGHWRMRAQVVLQGRAPVTDAFPHEWYESPNVHFLTMKDFRELARLGRFQIIKELPIIGGQAVARAWAPNLRAHSALYVLQRQSGDVPTGTASQPATAQ